jgi:hypothetical protein
MYALMELSGQEYVDMYASTMKERLASARRVRPVTDFPVIDQAVIDQAVIDQAVIDQAVIDQAVIDQAVIDQAVIDQAVIDQPTTAEVGDDGSAPRAAGA